MKMATHQNRRTFLKKTALGAASAAFPAIVPASVFGQFAPSNRIVLGAIGVGSQGSSNLRWFLGRPEIQVISVCDVDAAQRAQAAAWVNTDQGNEDCAEYGDFRDLIADSRLDAVSLALPDHWHAIVAVQCARAGLDIYGEKPLARSVREGRAICDAVHRYGRVWQTGSWQRSRDSFRRACELVRNGRLGAIERIEVGLPQGRPTVDRRPQPPPERLDWDFWLGPAPARPYTEDIAPWNWRWILDYSGGQLTDWAGHHIDIAHWSMDKDGAGPVSITMAKGEYPTQGLWNAPTHYFFRCEYEDGLIIDVADNSRHTQGVRWFGELGTMHVNREGMSANPSSILAEVIGPEDTRLYRSRDHVENFIDCVKSRRLTVAPVETAQRSITVAMLGEIAMLTGRNVRWDPATEQILNDPGASQLLGRSYREPWVL